VEGVVRAERVFKYPLARFRFVFGSGDEEDKTARITGVLGENGMIEKVFGEEIRASYESMPCFADTLESDQRFWRQPRQYLSAGLDGVFLWYTDVNRDLTNDRIVAFDFSEEEFITMTYPDLEVEDALILTKLKGSVAMVVFPALVKEYMYLHIWVMLEFGFSESWTRLLSIELPLSRKLHHLHL
jgi:hypothetical protein